MDSARGQLPLSRHQLRRFSQESRPLECLYVPFHGAETSAYMFNTRVPGASYIVCLFDDDGVALTSGTGGVQTAALGPGLYHLLLSNSSNQGPVHILYSRCAGL